MKSLRWRFTLWFGLCLFSVVGVFMVATHYHLEYELRRGTHERLRSGNENWALHGAYSEAEVHDIAGELWRSAFLYAGPILLLALVIGYLLARRAFAPIADMRRQLHKIGARNLTDRVRLADADQEFCAIETAINGLLTRLETTFAQLTEYSAQVAHELRTPLTLLRLKVEESAHKMPPDLSDALQEELARLSEYVDQSLLLATAEQGRLKSNRERLELRALLADVLDNFTLLARAEGRDVRLHTTTQGVVLVDPSHARQMLHNLLTNAIQHGIGTISISLETIPGEVVCRIENEIGPKPAARHRNAGLGLRIVHALAGAQGITVSNDRNGSLYRVEIRISSRLSADESNPVIASSAAGS
jgi:signal transduction histidine kinase